jgi:hypothetical protein
MKTLTLKQAVQTVLLLGCTLAYQASANVVGYVNVTLYPGDNLIANQLQNTNNTLDTLFTSPAVPNGATFTKWNPVTDTFLPTSIYDASSQTWSINYDFSTFTDGQGGVINSPSLWTNTFVGNVVFYSNITPGYGGPNWNPNYASGLYLLGCPEPLGGPIDMMFTNVVGRLPNDGEWVRILNAANQTYTSTTFHTGTGWDNGDPMLAAGQAAWFNLVVPEPSSLAIIAVGAVTRALLRRRNRGH